MAETRAQTDPLFRPCAGAAVAFVTVHEAWGRRGPWGLPLSAVAAGEGVGELAAVAPRERSRRSLSSGYRVLPRALLLHTGQGSVCCFVCCSVCCSTVFRVFRVCQYAVLCAVCIENISGVD